MLVRTKGLSDHEYMDQLQANRIILQQQIKLSEAVAEGKPVDLSKYDKGMSRGHAMQELREVNRAITQLYNSMYDENGKLKTGEKVWELGKTK